MDTSLLYYGDLQFFYKNPQRLSVLKEFEILDDKLRNIREYENKYNNNCIIIFESKYGVNRNIPFTLDLHGFRKESGERALKDFTEQCLKHSIPIIRIIFGRGSILSKMVLLKLNDYNLIDFELNLGYVDIFLRQGNYKLWPMINHHIKKANEENFKWECAICRQDLVIPKIQNTKLKATCSICGAHYNIFNDEISIVKEIFYCKKCGASSFIPLTNYKLKITCSNCNLNAIVKYGKEVQEQKTNTKNFSSPKTNLDQKTCNDNCYIATYVYINPLAIELQTLRTFRDDYLSKKIIGRIFCKIYYFISPRIIKYFKNSDISFFLALNIVTTSIKLIRKFWLNKNIQ